MRVTNTEKKKWGGGEGPALYTAGWGVLEGARAR
jgi:hypothetical protein